MNTKGIILASFGSIYEDAVEKSVGVMEKTIKEAHPDALVARVFLSDALVDKWNEKFDKKVKTLQQALCDFQQSKVEQVFVLPFVLVSDQCYQQMRRQLTKFTHDEPQAFGSLHVGRPLLSSLGVKNYADDYEATLEAVVRHINTKALNKAILLMANGQNQLEYSALQLKALYGTAPNVAVFTANGFPNFKQSLTVLERMGHKDVLVVPLALIGSSHLMDYLGGDRPDSIGALLAEEGYGVSIWEEGLGENPYIQELFMKHLAQIMRQAERRVSSTKNTVNRYEKIS